MMPFYYPGDIYTRPEGVEEDPDWVMREREAFGTYRDLNADGEMDHNEVKEWLIPSSYNAAGAEAKHLIYESDKNKVRIGISICIVMCCLQEIRICVNPCSISPVFIHFFTENLNSSKKKGLI